MKTTFYPYWRHFCALSLIFLICSTSYAQCVKPNAGADTTVCKTTVQLKAPSLGESWSFLSSSGGNTASISATGLATDLTVTGQYKFVLSKSASCRDTVIVTKSNIILARLPDQFICPGQVLTFGFNGLSGYSYVWNTGAITPNISVSPLATTNYVVTVTSSTNQCTYKDTIQVRVDPKPQAGRDTVFCTPTGQIAAAPNGETWSYVSASSGVTATPTIDNQGFISGLTQIGAYRFELKNAIGCTDTITVRRRSVTLPDIVRTPICPGTRVTFGFTNTTDFTYTWSTGATTPTITVRPDFSTDYIVTVKSLLTGCSIKDTISQIVNPKPFAGFDTIVCGSTSKQLRLPLADQTWSFIDGSAVATVSASGLVTGMTARGNYFFKLQSAAGCKDTVQIKRDEVVFRAAISAATCKSTQVNNDGQIYLSSYDPTAKYAINTNPMALPTASIGLPTIPSGGVLVNNLANPVAPQNYTLRIFSSYIDCYKDTTLTLDAINCNNCTRPDAGADIAPTCVGLTPITSATLNATAVAGGTWSQVGTTPTVAVFSSTTDAKATVTNLLPGTYQFKWTAGVDCADLVDVVIPDCNNNCVRPDAGANIIKTMTSATLPTTVRLNATAVANGIWSQLGTTPTVVSFSNASEANAIASNLIAGTYWFWWSVGSCQDSLSVTVVVENPCVKPNAGADIKTVCDNGQGKLVTLAATPMMGAKWTQLGTSPSIINFIDNTDPQSKITVSGPGSYGLIWGTNVGCKDTIFINVPSCNGCIPSIADAVVLQANCNGSNILNNGKIILNNFATTDRYQYSMGATFDSNNAIPATPSLILNNVIANNLPSPNGQFQAYTIRIINSLGCTKDITVFLLPTMCGCAPQPCVPSSFKIKKGK
jgi:hypothetical protein